MQSVRKGKCQTGIEKVRRVEAQQQRQFSNGCKKATLLLRNFCEDTKSRKIPRHFPILYSFSLLKTKNTDRISFHTYKVTFQCLILNRILIKISMKDELLLFIYYLLICLSNWDTHKFYHILSSSTTTTTSPPDILITTKSLPSQFGREPFNRAPFRFRCD